MKKIGLLLLSLLAVLQLNAQSVKFSSATPEAGKSLSFEYDPRGGKLDMIANVKCVAQTFVNFKQKPVTIPLTKEGSIYKGSFTPVDSTAIAVLTFSADGTKDDNPNGYYTLFYQGGKPSATAYYWEATFYNGMGSAFSGAKADKLKAITAFEKSFAADPTFRSKYVVSYLSLHYAIDKLAAEKLINQEIATLNASPQLSEATLLTIGSLYGISKRKTLADSVYVLVKTKFPTGTYAYNAKANLIYSEKDAVKAEALLNEMIFNFKLDPAKKVDADKLAGFYSQVASTYGLAKNNGKFEEYANKIANKTTLASTYNSFAWAGAEKKENLDFATKISKKSLELLEEAKNDPVPSYYPTKEEYLKGLESSYASYADTYALLLAHQSNYAEALKYQEDAVNKNGFSKPDMNARYVKFLSKTGATDKVIQYAERFIKAGQGSEEMKTDLKSAYKGQVPFDTYYAGLEKEAMEKEKAKWLKEMISKPAPTFALMNLKGEKVDLAKLKGKVVVIDYWATWCGPCIASFPGMQKAVDKYKSDPSVVFLFINTSQREENREKVVKDFMATTPYTFNVLLDTKSKEDENKFEVIDKYKVSGIPTKFVVDGNGNIRFTIVGFNGSADATVKELDMMIGLAKGTKEASK